VPINTWFNAPAPSASMLSARDLDGALREARSRARLLFLPDPAAGGGTVSEGAKGWQPPHRKASRQGSGNFAMESAHTSSGASA
jgi:hypothetical protein